ncbi:APC family permease [Pseudooceanicola spongiae]|uniref:Amino acid permease n=1 Tax=Pseudooceanicola spongiae TaxID=2613965 RepID=A0A7L9WQC9_9RHOB|nr:APC family permease [Pseudooceanicola spongiae]QOL82511.1 amino acid permease [Pseudooceanicola spongiae]
MTTHHNTAIDPPTGATGLTGNSVSMAHIVFFVVAAAAPLTAVVGATPPAFAFGSGVGVPGAFVVTGLIYLMFAVGFTAMSRHVGNAGAFYTYITRGLGKPLGVGGAVMALATYAAVQVAIYGLFSVFMGGAMASLGLELPWYVWGLLALAAVTVCGQFNIAVSGRILGVCMVAEIVILLLMNIGIVIGGGAEGLTLSGFRPSEVFGPGLGVTLVFVIGSFIGFEATAIFGEEAHEPAKTIPRATYVAVGLITAFYAFSTWAIVQYYGPSNVVEVANASLDGFYFGAIEAILGAWASQVMNILLITSLFACVLSFHNTLNRYFFALGREGLAWSGLARVHPRHASPHMAGRVQALIVAGILIAFAAFGADPYLLVFSWMSAFAVIGILAVQIIVSLSVIAFFRKTPNGYSMFTTTIAPAIAALCLTGLFLQVSVNLELLAGSGNPIVACFPLIILGLGLAGAVFAMRMRQSNPAIYDRLGNAFE